MKTQLVEYGRKFVSILGAYHRYCRSTAFYIKDREVLRVSVNSRIILNTAFFRKINPSYPRPQPDELARKKADNDNGWFSEPSSERTLDQIKDNGTEPTRLGDNNLLIYYPTVPGFSLGDKVWCIIISSPRSRRRAAIECQVRSSSGSPLCPHLARAIERVPGVSGGANG